jgi:putative oxidoreductase
MSPLKNRYLNVALRLLIGGMFVYAASDKVLYPQQFAMSVRAYQIVPVSISNLFALSLAWAELVAGAMLILGVFTRRAAGAVFLLLCSFVIALTTVLVRGMVIDCGCFKSGQGSAPVSAWLIIRNVLSLGGAWLIIQYNDGFASLYPGKIRRSGD